MIMMIMITMIIIIERMMLKCHFKKTSRILFNVKTELQERGSRDGKVTTGTSATSQKDFLHSAHHAASNYVQQQQTNDDDDDDILTVFSSISSSSISTGNWIRVGRVRRRSLNDVYVGHESADDDPLTAVVSIGVTVYYEQVHFTRHCSNTLRHLHQPAVM